MKKIILCSVWALMFSGIFISCQKEGPIGPAGSARTNGVEGAKGDQRDNGATGDKGHNGSNGAKGDAGNMAIVVKNVSISRWSPAGPASQHTGSANVAELTDKILTGGGVLVYHVVGSTLRSMPYTEVDSDLVMRYILSTGSFKIERDYSTNKSAPSSATNFRLVIIPGALGARVASGSGSGYSIDQLRAMSYEQVCAALNIRQ